MKRRLLALALLVALTGCEGKSAPEYAKLPPCATEDSTGPCYWDARSRGNGQGQSFWIDAKGRYHFVEE